MPGMSGALKRGALIVLEGCDKAGKSTHARLLVEALNAQGRPSQLICFPDRTTEIGKMIDSYLKCEKELKDEAVHLLFSANRWELVPKINELLKKGESVVLDRYAFSGVAFSAAKGSLDLYWCMRPDVGLPGPDRVIFLNVTEDEAAGRGDFGQERYEVKEFQTKVKNVFFKLMDDAYWKVVESSRDKIEVHKEILELALEIINQSETKPVSILWDNIQPSPTSSKQINQKMT